MNWFIVLVLIALFVGASSMFCVHFGGALYDSRQRAEREQAAADQRATWHYEDELERERLEQETLAALDECLTIVRGWVA